MRSQDLHVRLEFEEPLLGVRVSANGSNVSQRSRLIGALWGSYARSKAIFNHSSLRNVDRGRLWTLMMSGAVNYFVPVLRPNKQNINAVRVANTKIMRCFVRAPRDLGEPQTDYFKRRSAFLSDFQTECKCDCTDTWLRRLVGWCCHLARHSNSPMSRLLDVQGDSWLQDRRASHFDRPACRASSGFVSRWAEGWWASVAEVESLGWRVRKDDKIEANRRVDALKVLIFGAEDAIENGAEVPMELADHVPLS